MSNEQETDISVSDKSPGESTETIEVEDAVSDQEQTTTSDEGWLSGSRDVTEIPTVAITFAEVEVDADITFDKKHLESFLNLEGIGWNNFDAQKKASHLDIGNSRIRTYRKMYERLGLIFRDAETDTIKASKLGKKLANLSNDIKEQFNKLAEDAKENIWRDVRRTAVSILSKYQLRNPADNTNKLSDESDVLPCICIWKAMLELDNKLHYEEINRTLMRVMKMEDLDLAIKKIKKARKNLKNYSQLSKLQENLGIGLVESDQASARIAPWFSFAGWGGLIIETRNQTDGFRHLVEESLPLIRQAVQNPPKYFDTNNEQEWFDYYLSGVMSETESQNLSDLIEKFSNDLATSGLTYKRTFIKRFVASCQTKPFVILTGLSGSGKTKLAQAFARWITSKNSSLSDPFQIGAEIRGEQTTYHVTSVDRISVELSNSDDEEIAVKVLLPRELINQWVKCIEDEGFDRGTSSTEIREAVQEHTQFSSQLNSFHSPLKAAAFALINTVSSNSDSRNYELVAVGSDWTSKDSVLGYADALDSDNYIGTQTLDLILRAEKHPQLPHFLIFDEMNLSHVERYFADILSALESDEPIWLHNGETDKNGIPPEINALPKNLIIIGTVNVDETTYMFSPKVLDRANVIEFRVSSSDMESFLANPNPINLSKLDGKGTEFGTSFVNSIGSSTELDDRESNIIKEELRILFKLMEDFNMEFGYRNAREIIRFVSFYKSLEPEHWETKEAIDAQIFQKLLPKLNGSRQKVAPVLNALAAICFNPHDWNEGGEIVNFTDLLDKARAAGKFKTDSFDPLIVDDQGNYVNNTSDAFYPISFAKIRRMIEALNQGFTSFTEA